VAKAASLSRFRRGETVSENEDKNKQLEDENIALKEEVARLKEKAKSFDEALQTLYLLSDKDEDEDE